MSKVTPFVLHSEYQYFSVIFLTFIKIYLQIFKSCLNKNSTKSKEKQI